LRRWCACLLVAIVGCALIGGCSTGDISAEAQHSKQKEIDEATKKLGAEEKPREPGQQGD